MSLATAMAYDAERVVCNTGELGELVDYASASRGLAVTGVPSTWGPKLVDEVQGVAAADRYPVSIPAARLVSGGVVFAPERGDTLTRGAEVCEVLGRELSAGLWQLTVVGRHRVVPRGPR